MRLCQLSNFTFYSNHERRSHSTDCFFNLKNKKDAKSIDIKQRWITLIIKLFVFGPNTKKWKAVRIGIFLVNIDKVQINF